MTIFLTPDLLFNSESANNRLSGFALRWKQKHLLIRPASTFKQCYVPKPENEEWLVERLVRSPIHRVSLTLHMNDTEIALWANACVRANKAVYLQIPNTPVLPKKNNQVFWSLKRGIDWLLAAVLLLLTGPLFLVLALLMRSQSPGPIFFCQWRVGERGKLFRICKFRTMIDGAEQQHHEVMGEQDGLHKREDDPRVTPLGAWMRRYSLDELPQLWNVLRGEMSLVGPRPWALYDAVRIQPAMRCRLNALPGITGMWQVSGRASLRDIDSVNRLDLSYLRHWSLWKDFGILLRTVPRVISGFGAF